MAYLKLHIKDSKLNFFLELLRNLDFVSIETKETNEDDSIEEIKTNLQQSFREMKQIERGELKAKPAKDFLNEL